MSKANSQSAPILQADMMAVDELFKRIAERGRVIRTQSNTAETNNLGEETVPAVKTPNCMGTNLIVHSGGSRHACE